MKPDTMACDALVLLKHTKILIASNRCIPFFLTLVYTWPCKIKSIHRLHAAQCHGKMATHLQVRVVLASSVYYFDGLCAML